MNYISNIDNQNDKIKEAIPTHDNISINSLVEDKFNSTLFQDPSDIFNKNNSQRQFYTMPNTSAYNKQDEFAKWCYGLPKTCKEGNFENCPKQF